MLILTRKKNETIQIGNGVEIKIIRVSGNKVRLGIVAPKETRVLRIELDETDNPIEQQQQQQQQQQQPTVYRRAA